MGTAYARSLMNFSFTESLSSPSGHMIRIIHEYEQGRASLFMFLDKMISNHYFSVTGRARTQPMCAIVEYERDGSIKEQSVLFPQLKKKYGVIEQFLDQRFLWHSASELIAGMRDYSYLHDGKERHDYERLIDQLRRITLPND